MLNGSGWIARDECGGFQTARSIFRIELAVVFCPFFPEISRRAWRHFVKAHRLIPLGHQSEQLALLLMGERSRDGHEFIHRLLEDGNGLEPFGLNRLSIEGGFDVLDWNRDSAAFLGRHRLQ